MILDATSGLATSSSTTFRCRVSTCRTVRQVVMSGNTDSGFAAWCLALIRRSSNTDTTWRTVADRDVIGHTDAGLAARCAAVSGDILRRSTDCAVSRVAVCLNADSGLAT